MRPDRALLVTRKVFWSLRHDRRTVALILLAPIMAMVLFGFAFSGEVRDVRVIVVDHDEGFKVPGTNSTLRLSQSIVANIEEKKLDISYSSDLEGSVEKVREGKCNTVLFFPANFTKNVVLRATTQGPDHPPAKLTVRSDQSQVSVSSEVLVAVQEALLRTMKEKGFSAPLEIDASDPVYGKGADFIDMFVPGIMGFVVFLLTTLLTLISFVGERTRGTLSRLLAGSVTEGEIVVGYTLAFSIIGMVQVGILFVIATLVFDIIVVGNPLTAFLIASLLAIVSVSLGILLSSMAQRESQAIQFFPLIVLPAFLLSGVFWPREAMPVWLRPVSYLIPVTYAVEGLRSVFLRGWGPLDIWQDLLILLIFAAVFIFAATLTLKRTSRS